MQFPATAHDPKAGAAAPTGECFTLSVDQAATLLGISRALAYEAVRRGESPSVHIGRRILIPRAAQHKLFAAVSRVTRPTAAMANLDPPQASAVTAVNV